MLCKTWKLSCIKCWRSELAASLCCYPSCISDYVLGVWLLRNQCGCSPFIIELQQTQTKSGFSNCLHTSALLPQTNIHRSPSCKVWTTSNNSWRGRNDFTDAVCICSERWKLQPSLNTEQRKIHIGNLETNTVVSWSDENSFGESQIMNKMNKPTDGCN